MRSQWDTTSKSFISKKHSADNIVALCAKLKKKDNNSWGNHEVMTCRRASSKRQTEHQTSKKAYVATTRSHCKNPSKVDIAPTTSGSDDEDEDNHSNSEYLTGKEQE
eukprot:12415553-Ditylum_brightwellii.AAC.1